MARYRADLASEGFSYDAAQEHAVEHLQRLYEQLLKAQQAEGFWSSLWRGLTRARPQPLTGLYFWGGVGRGKTYLMDVFYDALPFDNKMRTHFHRFMRRVHHELTALPEQPDPLKTVADRLAKEAKILCFDEFFVVDITDAMILANLLEALFERGVTLVATSNITPDLLYKDGLQRARFLPAIDLLQRYTTVINVDGGVDYRLRSLEQAALYYSPLDDEASAQLAACFDRLAPAASVVRESVLVEIEGRSIKAMKEADDVVWFEFADLCDGPRSQNDYIELAREYHAVLLSGVPVLGEHNDDQARRFIYLVDEFYDRNVKLVISAEKPIVELYSHGRLGFEFQRTISRLQEMQSTDYLCRAHKP